MTDKLFSAKNILFGLLHILIASLMVFLSSYIDALADNAMPLSDSGSAFRMIGLSLLWGTLIGCSTQMLVRFWNKGLGTRLLGEAPGVRQFKLRPVALWGLSWGLIFLAWIPLFLAYFPGCCTYDTSSQLLQITANAYNDHHPLIHTLFIRFCLMIGQRIFGSGTAGIAFYTILQMLFLSCTYAFAIALVYKYLSRQCLIRKVPIRIILILLIAGSMFFPLNWYMAISVTKDTLFTGFFLLTIVYLLYNLLTMQNTLRIRALDIIGFFGAFGITVFRNNGKYALCVLIVLLLIHGIVQKKKLFFKLFLIHTLALVIGVFLSAMAFRITDAYQGDRREMLSMPIQQLARCMIYHGGVGLLPEDDDTMSEEDKALINEFLTEQAYLNYLPYISDPVKSWANTYVPRYDTKRFIKTYLRLAVHYPADYIHAWLLTNAGFLSVTDTSHAHIYDYKGLPGHGYIQTFQGGRSILEELDIRSVSLLPGLHALMEQWAEDNGYLKIPVLRYLFMPGVWLWLQLFWLLENTWLRKKHLHLLSLFVLAYYGTMLLGPTVQMRYIFPIMVITPYLMVAAFLRPLGGQYDDYALPFGR